MYITDLIISNVYSEPIIEDDNVIDNLLESGEDHDKVSTKWRLKAIWLYPNIWYIKTKIVQSTWIEV